MRAGTPVLGYRSLAAAADALAAAGVPGPLRRAVLEAALGRRFSRQHWAQLADRPAPEDPAPLSPAARAALARLGWTGAAGAARRVRPCLCCRAPFRSAGAHNRLCDRCRTRLARQAPGFEGVRW